jgi:lipopolysaccharide transport system ATP-binding protein
MHAAMTVTSLSKRYRISRHKVTTIRETVDRWIKGRQERTSTMWALRDVSFTIEHGRVFGIIGHNGAGKSTLLRLLCGLGRPTSGRIDTGGYVSGILELGGGFHAELTGRQNLMTVGMLNGLTTSEVKAREQDIIAFSELEDSIDQPVRTYSSGMYLRLAFAAAVEFDPAILVIDEVLSVGDERFQQKCLDRIAAFRASGKTLIITSHDTDQIQRLCDEVLVLEDGCAVMQGDPKSAVSSYHDLMRQRTERRAAQISGGIKRSLSTQTGSRQGTQEATIATVRLYSSEGHPVETVRSGEGIIVHMEIGAMPSVDDFALTVGIFSDAHVKCFEATISSVQKTFGKFSAQSSIRCHLKQLPLLPGSYFINIGIYPTDWSYVYDFHWQMHSLNVFDGRTSNSQAGGIVAVATDWDVIPHGDS